MEIKELEAAAEAILFTMGEAVEADVDRVMDCDLLILDDVMRRRSAASG